MQVVRISPANPFASVKGNQAIVFCEVNFLPSFSYLNLRGEYGATYPTLKYTPIIIIESCRWFTLILRTEDPILVPKLDIMLELTRPQ